MKMGEGELFQCENWEHTTPYAYSLKVHEVSVGGNQNQGKPGPHGMVPLVRREILGDEFKDVEKSVDHRP